MKKLILFILLLLLGLNRQSFAWQEGIYDEMGPYYKALKKFTHKKTNYLLRHLDTNYIWHGTFETEELRQAFEALFKQLYPDGQEGYATTLGKPWIEANPQSQFFLSLYAGSKGLDRLDGPETLWDLNLKVGDKIYKPQLIEPLPLNPFYGKFFPFIEKWDRIYRVVFPVDHSLLATQEFSLQLFSVLGASEMKFTP